MKWTIRNIYLYTVCLVTLMIMLFGMRALVRDVGRLVIGTPPVSPAPVEKLSPEEARRRAEENRAWQEWQRRDLWVIVISEAALLVAAGPLYLYHWRLVRRAEESELATGDRSSSA